MWMRRIVPATLAIALLSAGLMVSPESAQASSVNDRLYWVASTASPAVTNGLFGSTAGTVSSATNLGGQASLGRAIAATDNHLYFHDGTHIVRTALNGTGKTTVVTSVSAPGQIAVAGDFLYYTLYGSGVYGVSLSSLPATGVQIFTVTGVGWNGVAVSGSTIYAINNNGSGSQGDQGLYSATLNGVSAVVATMIDADAVMVHKATLIDTVDGKIYAASTLVSSIKVRDASGTWTSINVSAATSQSIYSVSVVDTTIYFSTNNLGQVGSVKMDGTGSTLLSGPSQFTSAWSIAALAPATYTVTYDGNGNTGGGVPVDGLSPYLVGSTATVIGNTGNLTKTDHQFYGWRMDNPTSGTLKLAGSTFTISGNTILYANWAGGPPAFSLSPGGPAITTSAFPAMATGETKTMTVYMRNTGALVFLGVPVTGSGVSITTNTCPSGGSSSFAKDAECQMTLSWTASSLNLNTQLSYPYGGPSPAVLGLTATVLSAPRNPTFSTPVATDDGYTVNVTNWNGSWTWTPSVSSGALTAGTGSGTTLPLTVTGLAASASAVVTVTTERTGYVTGTASVTGTAKPSGGGGGGGGSPSPSVNPTTPAPKPTDPPIITPANPEPLGPLNLQAVSQLNPGGTAVTVGGKQVAVTSSKKSKAGSVTGTGDDWSVTIGGRKSTGGAEPLTSGGVIQIPQGGSVRVNGSGYAPGTTVTIYYLSPALLLGSITVDSYGSFAGDVVLPAALRSGNAVIQVNGYANAEVVRSYSQGVRITKSQTLKEHKITKTVYFAAGSSRLSPAALRSLAAVAKAVPPRAKSVSVVSTGYVQRTPDTRNDYTLSTARAVRVANQLKVNGLKGKYYVTGRGIAKESGIKGRKVVVTITYTMR